VAGVAGRLWGYRLCAATGRAVWHGRGREARGRKDFRPASRFDCNFSRGGKTAMQEKTITITIDEQGNSTLDLNGFVGRECEKAFEDFRGGDTVKLERKTAAYYVTQDSQQERIRH